MISALGRSAILAIVAFGFSTAAIAADAKSIARNGDWEGYVYEDQNGKVCYMASLPSASKGELGKREQPYVAVTHRPASNSRDVFSLFPGYTFAAGGEAEVTIGEQKWVLMGKDNAAWAPTSAEDIALAQAMIKGKTMTITGSNADGQKSTDTFSLRGFTATHKAISQACGIKG